MVKVFIAYPFADRTIMQKVAQSMEARMLEVYTAENDLQLGARLSSKIRNAIRTSDALIAVVTKAHPSASVAQEVGYAIRSGVRVIPLVEEGANAGVLLEDLEQMRFNRSYVEESCEKVAGYISRNFEKSKASMNNRVVLLTKMLIEIGPDIPEIAKRIGETEKRVRSLYKEYILDRGYAIQASVNHDAIGLKRVALVIRFPGKYKSYAQSILTAMNELCYVVSFSGTYPEELYVVHAAVPYQHLADFLSLIRKIEAVGLFSVVETTWFDYFRYSPMKSEFYDFQADRWDFDWSATIRRSRPLFPYVPSEPQKIDYVDLLVIKELQIDANKSLGDISARLNLPIKEVKSHYEEHVIQRRLINGYRINWIGTRYTNEVEKLLHRKHRYLHAECLVKKLDEAEKANLTERMNKLPFLWFEAIGTDYQAGFTFPVDSITECFQYLQVALAPFEDRSKLYILNPSTSLAFTISYSLFDRDMGNWGFRNDLPLRFESLALKMRQSS